MRDELSVCAVEDCNNLLMKRKLHRLENGKSICQICYLFFRKHRIDLKFDKCPECAEPLIWNRKRTLKICLNYRNHKSFESRRSMLESYCICPECGDRMFYYKKKLKGIACCKQLKALVCPGCNHSEVAVKVKCNYCGKITDDYKRIRRKTTTGAHVLHLCHECEGMADVL